MPILIVAETRGFRSQLPVILNKVYKLYSSTFHIMLMANKANLKKSKYEILFLKIQLEIFFSSRKLVIESEFVNRSKEICDHKSYCPL